MRRTTGVVAVLVGAALGVGSGVLADGLARRPGDAGRPVADVAGVTPGGLDVEPTPTGLPGPSGPSGSTGPGTTPRGTASGTASTRPAPTTDPASPVTAVLLLAAADLGTAGWDTRSLTVRTQTGEGAEPTGVCQRESLVTRPGAGTRVRVDLVGRHTAAHEVAATFAGPDQARAAYDVLRADLAACRTGAWSPSGVGLAVGAEVRVGVPSGDDRGVWSTVVPAAPGDPTADPGTTTSTSTSTGTTRATSPTATPPAGVMGVLLVGRRVAVVQVDDPAPRPATVGTIMSLAAHRLAG